MKNRIINAPHIVTELPWSIKYGLTKKLPLVMP